MRKTPGKPKVALPQQGNVVAKSRKEECICSGRKVLEDITEENEHKEKSKEQRPKQWEKIQIEVNGKKLQRINNVNSCDKMSDKVTDKEIRQSEKDIEVKGIRVMFYIKNNFEILEN